MRIGSGCLVVYNSAFLMKPVYARAKNDPKRIVFCEGEDATVLRGVQTINRQRIGQADLGRSPAGDEANIAKLGLRLKGRCRFQMINQDADPR